MDTDVAIVGGGVAGLTAATFTARAGLDTLVVNSGEPLLARNAHLENVPGFPLGVNARTFLSLLREQAEVSGASFREGRVTRLTETDDGFELRAEADGETDDLTAERVVTASWSDSDYLDALDGVERTKRGSKTYVDVDEDGRTDVEGIYAAGRIAGKPHQTVISAGNGAEVALTVVQDADVPFYHDWVAPDGYFTGRGREVPPGCEEIDDEERRNRERASIERMREAFAEPQPESPTMHPSVDEDR